MKAWRDLFLYFLVLNVAVQYVTSLEEELTDSIFGELPVQPLPHLHSHTSTDFLCGAERFGRLHRS